MPETKPDLHIDEEGICNACRSYERRAVVDWEKRQNELIQLLERYRNKSAGNYDCIVPVSGGKDSTFQALKLKQWGFNPLCVTATTCKLTELGRTNIENLKSRGIDYIEYTTNPSVRHRINRIGLRQIGDISWPEHLTIFTIPVRMAVQMNIPLLVWGENSQNEYGGPAADADNNVLNRRWLEEFGGLLGMRVTDLIGQDGITERDLIAYTYPSDDELRRVGVTGLFLGYYIPWDGYANALFSQAHGMHTYPTAIEGSMVNYENMDNAQTGIHDYFKFLKFAFGRTTDFACLHLRRGRLQRPDAINIIRERDGRFPWTYLGYRVEDILKDIDLPLEEFFSICDRFTNRRLFVCDSRGNPVLDAARNLTKINYDNVEE